MPLRQLQTLLAVMSYHRCYGDWPSRPELLTFLGRKPQIEPLVVRGWLARMGKSNATRAYQATDRVWRFLGFSRFREDISSDARAEDAA